MRRVVRWTFVLALIPLGVWGYTQVMIRTASGIPPVMVAPDQRADLIRVDKSDRRLELLREGQIIATYPIALGPDPVGHKAREGDGRTPEERYVIDWRNPESVAHLSLHISYPNTRDTARATAHGIAPGGNIMIHGILNGWGFLGPLQARFDWTNGCIGVNNTDMRDIWARAPDGTPIEIEG